MYDAQLGRWHGVDPMAAASRRWSTFQSEPDTLAAVFDKDKVEKILTNLLSNAIKFTPDKGKVGVSIRLESNQKQVTSELIIEVQDNGIGIPAERLNHVFDRFYQGDNSHTRQFEGTGIGLALTKELVELLKGRIQVVSEVGNGSCFTVVLPIQLTSPVALQQAIPPVLPLAPSLPELTKKAILQPQSEVSLDEQLPLLLLVEDNTDLRAYIRSSFQTIYRVLEAIDGEQGLTIAQETLPDLIISDWMMPKLDGGTMCKQLKSDERTSHIPIILLTAKATIESKLDGLQAGADDYLTKPFHSTELAIRVKNLIEQRQRLRQHFNQSLHTTKSVASQQAGIEPHSVIAPVPTLSPVDEKFLHKLNSIIEANLSEVDTSIDWLEKEIGMSHAQFNRKLKALTNQSPSDYIRLLRLRKAAELLSLNQLNVSQVAYEVGFRNMSYFTRAFRQVYDLTPSQYAAGNNKGGEGKLASK